MTLINDTVNTIWAKVLSDIETKIDNREVFITYLSSLRLKSLDQNVAVLIAPDNVTRTLAENKFSSMIIDSLLLITETKYQLKVLTTDEDDRLKKEEKREKEAPTFFQRNTLNPKYTFENFVIGKSNREAYESATFVTEHLGQLNPLFIYSKSGLGKTHLLHAIGNAVLTATPLKKVLYITAEDFVDEYVKFTMRRDSQRTDQSLKDFFKGVDLLLIDDIQFFADKQNTCQMFFNIFNILVASNKQIVITSDRAPKDLEGLEERLVSRFSSGLTCSIKELGQDTLIEILRLKIVTNGNDLALFDDSVLSYLAKNNSHNVRELEGALNRILFYNVMIKNQGKISLEIAHLAFDNEPLKDRGRSALTPERIIDVTASYYNLAPSQITSKVRIYQITLARQIAIYLCRLVLDIPFAQIGKIFGKDHSTIMSSVSKVENLLKDDAGVQKAIAQLKKQLKAT